MTEDKIRKLREEINVIDDQLFDLLFQRIEIVRKLAELKQGQDLAIRDPDRETEILERMSQKARQKGLNADFSEIFRSIMRHSRKLQEDE